MLARQDDPFDGSGDTGSRATARSFVPVNLAAGVCILFGITLILQVQVLGDGMWFWYAKLLLQGRHLYGDLHLALQPLFVLVTAATIRMFGEGWLVGKLPAAAMLVTYVLVLRAIAQRAPVRSGPRAVLLMAAFAFPLLFEAARFDDYHVLADCFEVSSILLLLRLRTRGTSGAVLGYAAWLGIFSGLSMMSRLNDGGLLWATVMLALMAIAPTRKLLAGLVCVATAALTVVLTVWTTGDSLHAYATNSILRAASAKGGSSKLLHNPFHLVVETSSHFFGPDKFIVFLPLMLLFAAGVAWVARRPALNRKTAPVQAGAVVLVLTLMAYVPVLKIHRWVILTLLPRLLGATLVLAGVVIGIATLVRAARATARPGTEQKPAWNPYEMLLLIPLGQLISGSLSSAGEYVTLSAPIGILLLLLPIAWPGLLRRPDWAYGYAAVVGLASFCCLAYKTANPYAWHSYINQPLFTARQWYRHPVYGPMVIETSQLQFIAPVCERVHDVPNPSVLSLPFPYANYFCNVAPWNDQVQSFFDISTEQTIGQMNQALLTAPPHTIVYQRQLLNLLMHERMFNAYRPLPQRATDALIVNKLRSGEWSLAHQECVAASDWLVVETVPRAAEPPGRALPLVTDPYRCSDRKLAEEFEREDPNHRSAYLLP